MVSLNWCGFSAVQTLRRATGLALHGHRNGFGAVSRHPLLGISFRAYQVLWRLAGIDHMHVHGLKGKFSQPDSEVIEAAGRSEEHTSELQSLMRISYAVFCLKKKKTQNN